MNFLLTGTSAILSFANPFFLKFVHSFLIYFFVAESFFSRILTALTTFDIDPTSRSKTYIYVFFMFLASLLKSEVDAYNVWFGRRASTRTRIELQTAVYTKTLVRKDYSGIVKASAEEDSSTGSGNTDGAGADIGKIVNLMSNDSTSIAFAIEITYLYYVSGKCSREINTQLTLTVRAGYPRHCCGFSLPVSFNIDDYSID